MVQHLAQICVIDTEGVSWIRLSGRLKNVTKICPKTCISTGLMLHDITFFVTLLGFLNSRSKEMTKWSDSSMSATVWSSTSVARFVISQSKVWPRRWVGTLTNCSKLRLPSITFRAATQGSEGLSKWTLRSPTTNSLLQAVI